MPGMSGQETLVKIKEIDPNAKVIIASAHGDEKTKEFCLRNGASGYMSKPYTAADVSDKIKTVLEGVKFGSNENNFLTAISEKLKQNFGGMFGKNQRVEFQAAQLKKSPTTTISLRGDKEHDSSSEIPTLEIPNEQKAFTTELTGKTSGAIISVVPDKFIEMIQSFSGDTIGIEESDDLTEFFNILNGTILSAIGNFLKIQLTSNPVRPFDSYKDKTVNNMDLMEINYTFELDGKSSWFTIHLWMDVLPDFENKLDNLDF
jgi:CheY-like chemotaxis protein